MIMLIVCNINLLQVTVEALEKGIQVNLYSERSCPGLLVFVLKVFEELSLNVLEARVSCTGSFHLEALGAQVFYLWTSLPFIYISQENY